jgi:CHAT domain-containing protein/Flp pilus assembly protein TadD
MASLTAVLASLLAAGTTSGVVVQRVAPGSVAERAGLRPGDRLSSWEQAGASGALASPFDLMDVEAERAPRGAVRLLGARGDEPLDVSLWPDEWGIDLGPADPPPDRPTAVAHRLSVEAAADLAAERYDEAAAGLARALELRQSAAPDGLAVAASRRQLAELAAARGRDMVAARVGSEQGLNRLEAAAPRSLALVRALNAHAGLLGSGQARPLIQRAVALAEELAPDSLLLALSLQNLATTTSDPVSKLELSRRSLELRERLAPEGLEVAASLKQLGRSLHIAGDLAAADGHLRRALRICQRLAPGSRQEADVLNTLAVLRGDRGDLAEAEGLYRRSLEITERVQPDSPWVSVRLQNLAILLQRREELAEAETLARRAVVIAEREAPGSDIAAYSLINLGSLMRARGDDAAEATLRRSLAMLREENPRDRAIADALDELGGLLKDRGRFDEARDLYGQALEVSLARGPRSLDVSTRRRALGTLALERGDLDAAALHLQEALSLRRALTPGSLWEAESAHDLGRLARRRGRTDEALGLFRDAVAALESQGLRLGGDKETAARFRASYQELYRDLEELLLLRGDREGAFGTLERSRARGLLALLEARDLRLAAEVPEELERERRQSDAEHDRVLRELTSSRKPPDDAALADLRRRLEAARQRQDQVRERIAAAAPRLGAIRDPAPLDLSGVRQALDPGTLLLSFSVGPEASRVYAVGPGPGDFDVRPLGVTGAELRRQATRFRELIEKRRGSSLLSAVQAQARSLTRLLLGPVAERLASAERVLVVPDGVLHLVPFAALRDPGRPGRYLVEARPLHVVSSVTLFARLCRGPRPPAGSGAVVGLADPAYPVAAGAVPALRRSLGSGVSLLPLPWTRDEARALRALSPSAQVWTGADATEERAKSVGRGARVLHFACHGFLDEAFPLESGLALAIPPEWKEGEDNGFLQAWEVFEGKPVDADLVTLSACQTGLGKEVAGEGLLGLTWAFQYAGARSVLASLWEVGDASTAALMRAFYAHLARGAPKAEALRAAQLELLREPATSSPFFWAAFQLVGDWR